MKSGLTYTVSAESVIISRLCLSWPGACNLNTPEFCLLIGGVTPGVVVAAVVVAVVVAGGERVAPVATVAALGGVRVVVAPVVGGRTTRLSVLVGFRAGEVEDEDVVDELGVDSEAMKAIFDFCVIVLTM